MALTRLTSLELDQVLSYIRTEIVKIQRIRRDLKKITESDVLQRDPNIDENVMKRDYAKNIVKAIRFIIEEQGITQLPKAFTRLELDTLNVFANKDEE